MSIVPFLRDDPFEPELVEAMSAALADVCAALGLTLRPDPATERVALKVIYFAQCGVRDASELIRQTREEFRMPLSDPCTAAA